MISNQVRLPVFGLKANIMQRTEENISKKNYLLMKDGEFYTNSRLLGQQGYSNFANHKYVLDPSLQQTVATAEGRTDRELIGTVGLKQDDPLPVNSDA